MNQVSLEAHHKLFKFWVVSSVFKSKIPVIVCNCVNSKLFRSKSENQFWTPILDVYNIGNSNREKNTWVINRSFKTHKSLGSFEVSSKYQALIFAPDARFRYRLKKAALRIDQIKIM